MSNTFAKQSFKNKHFTLTGAPKISMYHPAETKTRKRQ